MVEEVVGAGLDEETVLEETVLEAEVDTELDVETELAVEEVEVELVDGGTEEEEELEAVPC